MDSRQELISELARVFGEQPAAEALLAEIGYPGEFAPEMQAFGDATLYWSQVLVGIENGLLPDGLRRLVAAARNRFPGNQAFLRGAGIDPDSVLGETDLHNRPGEQAGEWPTLIFRGSDRYDEFLRIVRGIADPHAEILYAVRDEAAILVSGTSAGKTDPSSLVTRLQHAMDDRGLRAEVRFERYPYRPHLISQLRLIGPDGRAFLADNVPNATLVRDLPQALSTAYPEISRRHWPSRVAVERVWPIGTASAGTRTARLDPDQTLEEAAIDDGAELRVSGRPEAPTGYEISRGEGPNVGKVLTPNTIDRLIAGDATVAAAMARRGESQQVELKEKLPQEREIAKEIAALANSGGGVLIVGTADDGEIIGRHPADADMAVRRIREIANQILPDLTHVRSGQVGEGWLAWAVVEPADEPAVTAEGAYWRRTSNRILRAELPSQGLIDSDPSTLPEAGPIRVFVAMSFREEEEPALVDYWQAMLRAANQARRTFNLIRLDDVQGDYDIVERIYKEIDAAHMVIADLTLSPPNVYLEIGYARGRGKQVIQICRYDTQLEFDVRGRRTLTYRNATTLEHKLLRELDAL
jgi:Putative DNA-binding domain/Effector-associated domain 1/YukD-like N-terminal domain